MKMGVKGKTDSAPCRPRAVPVLISVGAPGAAEAPGVRRQVQVPICLLLWEPPEAEMLSCSTSSGSTALWGPNLLA